MNFRRLKQVCKYGWQDAKSICQEPGVNKGHLAVFGDILHCYLKYNVWSNQYKKEKIYTLPAEQRKAVCLKYQEKNTNRDKWVKDFFDNYKFLNKWSSFKYERSASLQAKRRDAYKKQYSLGENCFIGYDVVFHRHHYCDSHIFTGPECLIAEHVDIDYTGGLTLGKQVAVSEGVKILTHNHELFGNAVGEEKRECMISPLLVHDHVWIGARSIILPGAKEIGRSAIIGAGSIVKNSIPPYAVVLGNPAKIVGFVLTPKEAFEYEKTHYLDGERLPLEMLQKNYEKYYLNRIGEIKQLLKL